MKKFLLLTTLLAPLTVLEAQNYPSMNVNMLGQWNNPSQPAEPVYGIKYQGVWGWYQQSTNKEYAIIGTSTGTSFIDVTNPASPVECDYIPATHGDLIWHEIKSYQNYIYIVSDDNAPNSLIIADMSYLPDSVHIVRNDNTLFERCHTIYVDGDKLYGGSVTMANGGYYTMKVWDLGADPVNPPMLRALDFDYSAPNQVHDMFVRNDTVYASGGYSGLYIFHFNSTTNNHFSMMAALNNYPEQGYNHSSFLTQDAHTLIFMDEVPAGRGIKSLDVTNFGNLTINQVFRSDSGNTPHNPYIIGNNVLVCANYTDGIQIFDISNPSNIVRTGYFDSDTTINYPNYTQDYHGVWGAYTDLPSGHLLSSDMQNGLYILDITQATLIGVNAPTAPEVGLDAFPNPFDASFFVNLKLDRAQKVIYTIYDNSGKLVYEETKEMPMGVSLLEVQSSTLSNGIYSVRVDGENFHAVSKLIKTN